VTNRHIEYLCGDWQEGSLIDIVKKKNTEPVRCQRCVFWVPVDNPKQDRGNLAVPDPSPPSRIVAPAWGVCKRYPPSGGELKTFKADFCGEGRGGAREKPAPPVAFEDEL